MSYYTFNKQKRIRIRFFCLNLDPGDLKVPDPRDPNQQHWLLGDVKKRLGTRDASTEDGANVRKRLGTREASTEKSSDHKDNQVKFPAFYFLVHYYLESQTLSLRFYL